LALSGGLDSRLLAAMLTREGLAATAVTNGLPGDIEYRCAKRVAATLGMPQVLLRSPPDACDFVRDVEWDAPSSGPFFVFDRFISDLGATAPRIISGYLMDTIIGGPNIDWCYDAERRTQGYDTFFSALNRWGISPMRLQLLLRSDVFGDAVAQTQAGLQREFESVAETDLARAWLFELRNRGRYWIGSGVTRQARSAWPEIPHTDREILKFAGGVPMGMLSGRRLQMDLIQSLYPEIAQIPRDRNSWDMRALSPTARDLVRQALWRRFRALRMKLRLPHAEQRYYYRMFDINAPHWMEVRRRVEPYRESAHAIFNREELARIWPPVDVTWTQGHPIESGNGARLILSIAAWLGVSGARVGSA
jgi:asparagine synthase (glutamine-hydrolysing)